MQRLHPVFAKKKEKEKINKTLSSHESKHNQKGATGCVLGGGMIPSAHH